ncbi:MAG TPA: dihydrolipoamide acetyltransferase family protein [Casimicrobiaceae bacterium]|nr:dihydrolipoamide acetyltransferase family protein [Casimicrobiaceae bacterium]
MSIHVVKVPDIGEGIAEVELVEWRVRPGDTVVADQPLVDVMTDKATVEVPSPVDGKVIAANGTAGDKLAVGSELLRLETNGTGTAERERAGASGTRPAKSRQRAEAPETPSAKAAATPASTAPPPAANEKPLASPSVRRHARELGVDLSQVRGSGPDGRIVHEDVVRHAAGGAAKPAVVQRYAERDGEHAMPVIGMRRQIALHMQATLRIPHFTYVEEVDVTDLEVLRSKLNERFGETRGRLTVLPFLMRAIVLSVNAFPQMNARFDDEKGIVTRFEAVNIGIATQTDAGLMVPVVRHAEARDLWASAAEVARLADAARASKAARDEISGSTITVTSLGPLGGIVTTPVINAPEVAIVGVNRIVERPVVHAGAIVPRRLMNLSSSFDHRVVDGQQAAEFVQALRGYLECPALLFVE